MKDVMMTKLSQATTNKKDPVAELRSAIDKEFGKATIRPLSDGMLSGMHDVMPTKIDVLDNWLFGCGGLPGNKIGEIFGDADSGKTSIGCLLLGAAQNAGGLGILAETEHTLNEERAELHCDIDKVLLIEPPTTESVVDQIDFMLEKVPKNTGPNVIVWDSLAASDTADDRVGGTSRLMAKMLPRISKKLGEKRTAIVVINQNRQKIGVVFGSPVTTPGGNTLKYMASWRMQLWRGKSIKKKEDEIGIYTTVKMMKNKLGWSGRKAKLALDFRKGWLNKWTTMNLAKDRGLIDKGAKLSVESYNKALAKLIKMEGWYNKR
jgi:recombination protein RecA